MGQSFDIFGHFALQKKTNIQFSDRSKLTAGVQRAAFKFMFFRFDVSNKLIVKIIHLKVRVQGESFIYYIPDLIPTYR
ncbi:MAG: hypothetical protein RLZZ69_1919 [Cyanobacteriota bacterium]|jgi:hypothetical protein